MSEITERDFRSPLETSEVVTLITTDGAWTGRVVGKNADHLYELDSHHLKYEYLQVDLRNNSAWGYRTRGGTLSESFLGSLVEVKADD